MIHDDQDRELKQRFQELRAREGTHIPDFELIAPSPSLAKERRAWRWPVSVAAAIAVIWLARARVVQPDPVNLSPTRWQTPTDVLLNTPGSSALHELPQLHASMLDPLTNGPTPTSPDGGATP